MSGLRAGLGGAAHIVTGTLRGVWQELGEIRFSGPRARHCLMVAMAVPLATTLALALALDSCWWAAITAFMTTMATATATVQRITLRLAGTVAGAAVAFVMARWLVYDVVALTLFLALSTMLGVVGLLVSPHGLVWLFATITSNLVLLMSLENPLLAPYAAFNRVAEVAVGSVAALAVITLVHPGGAPPPAATAPGWRGLLGPQWPVLLHGVRAAITVVVVLHVWRWIDLPSLSQMAITIAVVMAAPTLDVNALDSRHLVVERALHRVLGCLVGGVVALVCLLFSIEDFLPWLAMIGCGVWLSIHIQNSTRGIGYVGTQAGVVFIMTVIQGAGPPDSVLPGIDRFVGITAGLGVLFVVSLLIWPDTEAPAAPAARA